MKILCQHCLKPTEVVIEDQPRTTKQNSSMWKYCEKLAEALNDAGFTQESYPFRQGLQIPWTKNSVMEVFWRPVQAAMVEAESTTKLSTKDVQAIYQALDRAMSERTGVHVEWPCRESQMMEALHGEG